jgi:hypothetical protein
MSDNSTRIIELGICVDNKDPLGLGRIRVQTFSGAAGPAAQAFNYEPWDEKDPFIALPFLPHNINYIPLIKQAVKIINYDPVKDVVNREYISGPFTTIHDFNNQVFSSQAKYTTYGGSDTESPKIVNKEDGEIIDAFAKSSIAKYEDYAIYGKNGSDIILTENGVSIRGGKFLPKTMLEKISTPNIVNKPYMSEKSANLYLKKFDDFREEYYEDITEVVTESQSLKSIIEYSVDKFDGSNAVIKFYVYLIKGFSDTSQSAYGGLYRTDNPKLSTAPLYSNITQLITDGTNLTYTFKYTIYDILSDGINGIYKKIRTVLKKIHTKTSLKHIDSGLQFANDDLHPFYFRPTLECSTRTGLTQSEVTNRVSVFNNIFLATGVGPKNGLVYSRFSFDPPTKIVKRRVKKIRIIPRKEQTFSALKSDKIYFLSTKSTPPTNTLGIDMKKLDLYELTHENYMEDIQPYTYASVRGGKLVTILQSIVDLIYSHQHNVVGPPIPSDPNYIRLQLLMSTIEDDILNDQIRIN